jgi:protein-tyrosine-phosphatase
VRKHIVFTSEENAERTQLAEALARMYGGNTLTAYSAGTKPATALSPLVAQIMLELGYDMRQHHPKSCDDLPHIPFDVVVFIGSKMMPIPLVAKRLVHWRLSDSRSNDLEELRQLRTALSGRIKRMLHILESMRPGQLTDDPAEPVEQNGVTRNE